jgi:murein DD-endopeptidase MepM/ murein hydrolase activator NlpD
VPGVRSAGVAGGRAIIWDMRCLSAFVLIGALGCGGTTAPSSPGRDVCAGFPAWQTSPYVLPYPVGTAYRVNQGNCSGEGHSGNYRYGYDFDMPIGTLVTAARDGIVFEVRTGFVDGDLTPGHENFVKIQHADGHISAYSHLSSNGVLVQPGEHVRAGDPIGLSGNTGETGGFRHLHFHLSACSEPADCGTLPVTFRNTAPNPMGLQPNVTYAAGPH